MASKIDRIEVRHIADGEFEVVRGGWVNTPTGGGLVLNRGETQSAAFICRLREVGNEIVDVGQAA